MADQALTYRGRFAPSPTGPLHYGSLLAAVASFLDARSRQGEWLIRIEDLDPPREDPAFIALILESLEAHNLNWDGDILYQGTRSNDYADALHLLESLDLIYPCSCSRQRIRELGNNYDSHCRIHPPEATAETAIRLDIEAGCSLLGHTGQFEFEDLFLGRIQQQPQQQGGDFIVKRKDGLYAYQLAVVVDDIHQGINTIIRGADLLEATSRQVLLFRLLQQQHNNKLPEPRFGHIPIAVNEMGQKLSKQHHAPPLDNNRANTNLWHCLEDLGQQPPGDLCTANCEEILSWGIKHWQRKMVPRRDTIDCADMLS